MTDAELVARALDGAAAARSAAYGSLAHRWAARVLAVCHARVGSAQVAEDLAQDALLRGLMALPTLSEPAKFGPWLCGIAVRTCLDWLKSPRRSEVSLDSLSSSSSERCMLESSDMVDESLAREEQIERVMREVERLPPAYREILIRYYSEDFTYEGLASELGISGATVNARLTKARAMLRLKLLKQESEA